MKKVIYPFILLVPTSSVMAAGLVVDTFSENWATGGTDWTLTNADIRAIETSDPGGTHPFVDLTLPVNGELTGQWLFSQSNALLSAERTITTAAPFDNVSITQALLAVAGGMDLPPQADSIRMEINGVEIFNIQARGRNDGTGGYLQTPAGSATISAATPYHNNSGTGGAVEFLSNRTDAWGMDTLFDAGLDPAFDDVSIGALTNSATIRIESIITEGTTDEAWGLNNLEIEFSDSTQVPEPTSSLLLTLVGACSLLRRRRS